MKVQLRLQVRTTGVKRKKIDLIVRELSRYDVKVAALQETKWFGSGVYYVGGSVVLAAGRDVPAPGNSVAIVQQFNHGK